MPIWTPLRLEPNLRFERPDAETGYVWGQPCERSAILKTLNDGVPCRDPRTTPSLRRLGLRPGDVVAERWIVSDDPASGSRVAPSEAPLGGRALTELLNEDPVGLLGPTHVENFGSSLATVMKLLDTHDAPGRGALSVQVHPPTGYPGRPPKPEMWRGSGKIYLGWRKVVTEDEIRAALRAGRIESLMNRFELHPEDLVLVPGGVVHAIRAGTFTAEWSMAPGGGPGGSPVDLTRATATLFDGTDGRPARPGKEDVETALDIMRASGGFDAYCPPPLLPRILHEGRAGDRRSLLFRTAQVFVEEWRVASRLTRLKRDRGFGVYLASGALTLHAEGSSFRLEAAEEAFVPASCELLDAVPGDQASEPARLYAWYAPLEEDIVRYGLDGERAGEQEWGGR